MTKSTILKRLADICAIENEASGSPFICCDMLYQETLIKVQEELAQLMCEIANEDGWRAQKMLNERLPHTFGTTKLPEAK